MITGLLMTPIRQEKLHRSNGILSCLFELVNTPTDPRDSPVSPGTPMGSDLFGVLANGAGTVRGQHTTLGVYSCHGFCKEPAYMKPGPGINPRPAGTVPPGFD